jgi:cytidylate kinase
MGQSKPKRITITGDPGSGKSTFARNVADFTGFSLITTGTMFREIASQYGVSVTELNKIAEARAEIDYEVDNYLKSLNQTDNSLVIDSRMAWHFVNNTFKVRLTVSPEIAVKRIFEDENEKSLRERFGSIDEAMREVNARKHSEVRRYYDLYAVDISDLSNFDLVLDTSHKAPEAVIEEFKQAYAKHFGTTSA